MGERWTCACLLQEKAEELIQDKHARSVVLQLLAPDKPRYLQPELLSVVMPELQAAGTSEAKATAEDQAHPYPEPYSLRSD